MSIMPKTPVLHGYLSEEMLAEINRLIAEGHYASQAEAIRHGLRLLIKVYR